ncbi:MAG: terpene cyclase/mutase family protein [Thermoguttaceae bacterium]|nr:terpene cyclase/mutase family protein [Thermoguttaceae bacterium]
MSNQPQDPYDPFADPNAMLANGASGENPNESGENGEKKPDGNDEEKGYFALLFEEFLHWAQTEGTFWASSFAIHSILMTIMMFIGSSVVSRMDEPVVAIEEADVDLSESQPLDVYEFVDNPTDDLDMNSSLTDLQGAVEELVYDESDVFQEGGGGLANTDPMDFSVGAGGELNVFGSATGGVSIDGLGGVGVTTGEGNTISGEGGGTGGMLTGRGSGHREALGGTMGGTAKTDQAVAGGLNWIARHQAPNGTWSCQNLGPKCDCTQKGSSDYTVGATALGVLPFLAAGITGEEPHQYRDTVRKGIAALAAMQDPKTGQIGDASGSGLIYGHSLATIALCEAFAMTGSGALHDRAQAAIMYLEYAQDPQRGGWRYTPRNDSDTSVTGWALMGLKSGQMAGLSVNQKGFDEARRYLKSVSSGSYGELYSYTSGAGDVRPSMTAAGLLCMQYLEEKPESAMMREGQKYLLTHRPGTEERNLYYTYYAVQVMHNLMGPEWDKWNRAMRRDFIDSQIRTGCAAGSWDLTQTGDSYIRSAGGRLVGTCLAVLSLEVYYRHLPLFKINKDESETNPVKVEDTPPPPAIGEPQPVGR